VLVASELQSKQKQQQQQQERKQQQQHEKYCFYYQFETAKTFTYFGAFNWE